MCDSFPSLRQFCFLLARLSSARSVSLISVNPNGGHTDSYRSMTSPRAEPHCGVFLMAEPKDKWDKFDIGSKFAVSVAIAVIAGLYTCSQNNAEQRRQTKTTEDETLSKCMPYLSGKDQSAKK